MKKPLAIQLEFDIKTVRKTLVLLTGEIMEDDEIISKFFHRDPVKIDVEEITDESESLQLCLAFVANIIARDNPNKSKSKSKFKERLEKALGKDLI